MKCAKRIRQLKKPSALGVLAVDIMVPAWLSLSIKSAYQIMTTLLAVMDFKDLAIGAVIGAVIAIFTVASKADVNAKLLALQLRELQKKLDALLKHQGVQMPPPPASGLSPELERLASIPETKIAAIKLYRQENPGASLREAKEKIEAFYKSRQ